MSKSLKIGVIVGVVFIVSMICLSILGFVIYIFWGAPHPQPCLYQTSISAPSSIGGQDCQLKCDGESNGEVCDNCDTWYQAFADGKITSIELPRYCREPVDNIDEIGVTPKLLQVGFEKVCLYQISISAPDSIGSQDCQLKCNGKSNGEMCDNCELWYKYIIDNNTGLKEFPSYCKDLEDGGDEIGVTPELIKVP